MGYWTLVFLLIAIVTGVLGFTDLAGASAWIAQGVFVASLVLFLAGWAMGGRRRWEASGRLPAGKRSP